MKGLKTWNGKCQRAKYRCARSLLAFCERANSLRNLKYLNMLGHPLYFRNEVAIFHYDHSRSPPFEVKACTSAATRR